MVKNSNGDTRIGEVTGDLRVKAANGRISVDQADAAVTAKTANGDVRLGEVARGAVVAETGAGTVEVGVRDGVAAWLDLNTRFGNVQNDLRLPDLPNARTRSTYAPAPPGATSSSAVPSRTPQRGGMTTTMVRPALKATGLRKSFGEKTALDGIDLNVAEGSIFALLGPNGAGKTTTVQILSTLIGADGGDAMSPVTTWRASPTRCAT